MSLKICLNPARNPPCPLILKPGQFFQLPQYAQHFICVQIGKGTLCHITVTYKYVSSNQSRYFYFLLFIQVKIIYLLNIICISFFFSKKVSVQAVQILPVVKFISILVFLKMFLKADNSVQLFYWEVKGCYIKTCCFASRQVKTRRWRSC